MRLIKFTIAIFACTHLNTTTSIGKEYKILYKDPKAPIEARINDLLSRMTLREKILQLNQYIVGKNTNENNIGEVLNSYPKESGSYIYFSDNATLRNRIQKQAVEETRLGIPALFGYDVIHGFRTIYPISLGQACSWNPDLVKKACAMAAQETRKSGTEWTFSPMIDVAHDGRWGRVSEGYGEDPYTNAVFGVASVLGYQGNDLSNPKQIAACLKHYVGYGASEGGRDYRATDISNQTLWSIYMPPYEACIKAGAATVMSAFNDINGIPATANYYTLTEILKKRWKHDGFVVSDWNAVEQLINQGIAANRKEAALKAFSAGTEMNMTDNCYAEYMEELVNEGKIKISQIDEAVGRILRIKFRLGLFENPYTPEYPENQRVLLPENRKLAEKLAEESMVLLKNKNQILPLNQKNIAVIGPMVKDRENIIGSWTAHGRTKDVETLWDGLKKEFTGKATLSYAKGCEFEGSDTSKFNEAIEIAKQSDIIILCLGERRNWSGENGSRSTLALPIIQEKLAEALCKTGKPIILVLSSGRPIELCRLEPICDAIIEIWQPGICGGTPLAGILSGRINPSGKLAITFPYSTGQITIYYNMRQSARPFDKQGDYQDIPTTPLYEFAHGLSYTNYEYGELKASTTHIKKNETVNISIPITNIGNRDGEETVHWFISDPVCSISRPIKELKHFEKHLIKKDETITYTFTINPIRDLSYVDSDGNPFLESGIYYISVKDKKIAIEVVE